MCVDAGLVVILSTIRRLLYHVDITWVHPVDRRCISNIIPVTIIVHGGFGVGDIILALIDTIHYHGSNVIHPRYCVRQYDHVS